MPAQNLRGFSEKVALVTDGASGVGRAVALQLALQGCYVIAGFSNADEESKRALSELQSLGTLAHHVEADCSTVEGARALVSAVENLYGRLDLLINTVKFENDSSFEEITGEIWGRVVDSNLRAMFFVTQAAIELMKARPKPLIVNVVSAGDAPDAARNVLSAGVRAGLVGMTESLALKLAPKFRVNCVAVSEKEAIDEMLDTELFKPKPGAAADDAARAVVYLLSSESIGLNGQILTVI